MKCNFTLVLLAICLCNLSFSQDIEKYLELIKETQTLYGNSKFEKSEQKYSEAFIAFGNQVYKKDRYRAACAWAMSNKIDSSFIQLDKISIKGSYLNSLHKDKRWGKVNSFVLKNQDDKKKADAKLDKELIEILDTIYKRDQKYRKQIREVEKKYGRESDEMKKHWKIISKVDSMNLIEVIKILDTKGWLGSDIIGIQGNKTLFLVVQHSNLKTQERYLPMMREAVKKGNAKASELAFLEDRVALRRGGKQIYGTQMGRDKETGDFFVLPLIDPDNVDKRRERIGLGTLASYYCHGRIKWDSKKHKKRFVNIVN